MNGRRRRNAQMKLLRVTFFLSLLALILSVGALFFARGGTGRGGKNKAKEARSAVPSSVAGEDSGTALLRETKEGEPVLQTFADRAEAAAEAEDQGIVTEEALPKDAKPEDDMPETFRVSRETAHLTEERINAVMAENAGRYYYDRLSGEEQRLYAEVFHVLTGLYTEVYVSAPDTDTLEKVQTCVMNDHPEIFYVNGYFTTRYTIGGETAGYTFTGRYLYDAAEISRRTELTEQYISECLSGLDPGWDDYGKIRYLYEYLIANTSYLLGAPDNQNICSVMIGRQSVCQGYAKAAQLLLTRIGIPATLVTGTAQSSAVTGPHAWNLVNSGGNWYYLDVTWGDASFRDAGDVSEGTNYDYLLTTTADISATHTIGSVVPMPVCDHLEDNYYVRENAWFGEASLDRFAQLVELRRAQGDDCVRLKCATYEVYEEMGRLLIDEKRIFDYIFKPPGESMMFTRSDAQRTITVWF